MLYSIYHMTLKLILKNWNFWAANVHFFNFFTQRYNGRRNATLQNLQTTSDLSILLQGVISRLIWVPLFDTVHLKNEKKTNM